MVRRVFAWLAAVSAVAAVPAAHAAPRDAAAGKLIWRRLSPAGQQVLRYATGEFDPRALERASPLPTPSPVRALRGDLGPAARDGMSGGLPYRFLPFRSPRAPANVRVNDVAKDLAQIAAHPDAPSTTQSETNLAASGVDVVVGYNDSATLNTPARSFSGFSVSHDAGTTWRDGRGVPSVTGTINTGDPGLAADRRGRFYYAQIVLDYRTDRGRGTLGVSVSNDRGNTFSVPVDIYPASPPLDTLPGPAGEVTRSLSDKELIAVDNSGGSRDGAVYVAWNQFAETDYPNGTVRVNSQILMVHSTDGGATWSDPVAVSPPHQYGVVFGNAFGTFVSGAVLTVGPNGEVYCAWEESTVNAATSVQRIARSDDGGATFALSDRTVAPLNNIGNVLEGVVYGGVRVNEFPDLSIDRRTGALYLVYAGAPSEWPGNLQAAHGADRGDIYLVRSTDRGATWSPPVRVNDDTTDADQFFPAVAVTEGGMVGVMWYDRRNDPYNERVDVYMARSQDGGQTFLANERITPDAFPLVQTTPNFDPAVADTYMGDYIDIAATGNLFHLAWGDNRDRLSSPTYGPRPDPNIYYARVSATSLVGGR